MYRNVRKQQDEKINEQLFVKLDFKKLRKQKLAGTQQHAQLT